MRMRLPCPSLNASLVAVEDLHPALAKISLAGHPISNWWRKNSTMAEDGRGARPHNNAGSIQSELVKQFSPDPIEVHWMATMNGHEIKLIGKTGETCDGAIPSRRVRRGSWHGQPVNGEFETSYIHLAPTIAH